MDSRGDGIPLYTGIDLFYTDIVSDSCSVQHEALAHIMQINYCRAGQIVWETQSGSGIAQMEFAPQTRLTEYQFKQIEIVREIHDQLLQHMEQRVTIEELSKQYLINPTTLKSAFKAVYGTSLRRILKNIVWNKLPKCSGKLT